MRPLVPGRVWYLSLHLPRGTRASYAFAARPPPQADTTPKAWASYFRSLQLDPCNPKTLTFPKDPEDPEDFPAETSVLELPGAPSDRRARTRPRSRWKVELRHIRSRLVRRDRSVWVGLPGDFDPAKGRYNLLILFDGFTYLHAIPTPRIVESLVSEGRIGPTVVVLVGNPSEVRNQELLCRPEFAAFLKQELIPSLRRWYGLSVSASRTVVAGSSLGGLMAAYVALRYPGVFGKVLAQSGAFLWTPEGPGAEPGWLIREFARRRRVPLEFYLDAGKYEWKVFPPTGVSLLGSVRHLRDVLVAKGYPVSYNEFDGGHDYACWRVTLADGLIQLLGTR